jgi:hypothetical protein
LRADWAAADPRAFAALARLARNPSTAVRGAALEVLRDMLASRTMPGDPRQLDGVADALREVLESEEAVTRVRLTALEALGHLLPLKADLAWPRELLIAQLTAAATHAERAAAAAALAHNAQPQAVAAVQDALAGLPLDEPPARERVYVRAAVRLDAAGAERILLARLQRSIAARQSLEAEIDRWARCEASRACRSCWPPRINSTCRPPIAITSPGRWVGWALIGPQGCWRAGCEITITNSRSLL